MPEKKEFSGLVAGLSAFFEDNMSDLHWCYDWFVPKEFTIEKQGSPYRDNVNLKEHYHRIWASSSENQRVEIAKSIVGLWGGIRTNKDGTIRKYVSLCSQENPETPFKGISSYSKILAIADPARYAIYDARVAVALNAIQYLQGRTNGIFFKYLQGRNRITGNSQTRMGFAYDPRFSRQVLLQKGWTAVSPGETYRMYLDVLHLALARFPDHKLYDLEMALFCNAERLALRAMFDDRIVS